MLSQAKSPEEKIERLPQSDQSSERQPTARERAATWIVRAVVALLAHARERHGGVLGRCRMAAADVALESVFAPGRML